MQGPGYSMVRQGQKADGRPVLFPRAAEQRVSQSPRPRCSPTSHTPAPFAGSVSQSVLAGCPRPTFLG